MGLLQKAVETYESHKSLVGVYQEGKSPLAPIAHTVKKADIEVTITADGKFFGANRDCKDELVIIPVSVESIGRVGSAVVPHPLSDYLSYLAPCMPDKYGAYLKGLRMWADSAYTHPKLKPILTYVETGTLLSDLASIGLIRLNVNGGFADTKDEKLMVRWRVIGLEDGQSENCWQDVTLFSAYTQYYLTQQTENVLCMVCGEDIPMATQHPKGIIPIAGNAKLISANDKSGFTYRGRFVQEEQTLTVSYDASQKAHNALRWLAQEQGVRITEKPDKDSQDDAPRWLDQERQKLIGGRTFLCWNPQGRKIITPMQRMRDRGEPVFLPSDYRKALADALNGRKAELKPTDGVVLAVFDAATTGRLALTYYNELQGHDFLQRLHDWDVSCCWPHWKYSIETPTLRQIVNCAFGVQRKTKNGGWLETDERILRQQMQRLVAIRVAEKQQIGADIVKALANRASRPLAYDRGVRENILFTACAVIRKHRIDLKEEWNMALEPEKKNRSYQFGRLLAVMEKIERDTYDRGEKREPNAVRLQSVFCRTPFRIARQIEEQLKKAYLPKLRPYRRKDYLDLLGEIFERISQFPEEDWNKSLEDTYLMGYYLQRNALYSKETNNTEEDEEQ